MYKESAKQNKDEVTNKENLDHPKNDKREEQRDEEVEKHISLTEDEVQSNITIIPAQQVLTASTFEKIRNSGNIEDTDQKKLNAKANNKNPPGMTKAIWKKSKEEEKQRARL